MPPHNIGSDFFHPKWSKIDVAADWWLWTDVRVWTPLRTLMQWKGCGSLKAVSYTQSVSQKRMRLWSPSWSPKERSSLARQTCPNSAQAGDFWWLLPKSFFFWERASQWCKGPESGTWNAVECWPSGMKHRIVMGIWEAQPDCIRLLGRPRRFWEVFFINRYSAGILVLLAVAGSCQAHKASTPSFPPRFHLGIFVPLLVAAVVDQLPPWWVTSVGWPRALTWVDPCGFRRPSAGPWAFGCRLDGRLGKATDRCWGCMGLLDPWQGASEMPRYSWMPWNPIQVGIKWSLTVPDTWINWIRTESELIRSQGFVLTHRIPRRGASSCSN